MNDIPLVRTNNVDDINASLIAVKKTISEKGDIREVNVDVSVHTDAVDEVTPGEMSPVTSNAVSVALSEESNNRNSAIANAIGNLSANSVGGSGKYISAISETDGVISATASDLATTVQNGNNQPVTSNAVASLIVNEEYEVNLSYSAGAIGSRGSQAQVDITKDGYSPISFVIVYISDSAKVNPVCFCANNINQLIVNSYRTTTNAETVTGRIRVTYRKIP